MFPIRDFLENTFPNKLQLNDTALSQLAWRLGMSPEDVSPEKCMVDESHWQTGQLKRTGAALYCHELLKADTDENYRLFSGTQHKHHSAYDAVLTREHFSQLCTQRQNRDPLYEDALSAASIIGAITLSDAAKAQADRYLGKGNWTPDSVEFVADTFDDIEKAKQIYPLLAAVYDKYPAEHDRLTKLFQGVFSHKLHIRHMLYTECNENGFRTLATKIRANDIDEETFQFLWDYWEDNIFGFRGNVDPSGSIYYTENTFYATQALKGSLLKFFDAEQPTPEAVFHDYLEQRAQKLKLNDPDLNLPADVQKLLAHLGAMLRLFHPEQGRLLAAGYNMIPEAFQTLKDHYFNVSDQTEPTSTYLPALFENGRDFIKAHLKNNPYLNQFKPYQHVPLIDEQVNKAQDLVALIQTIRIMLPFYLSALSAYRDKRQNDSTFNQTLPLSFRLLAAKDNIPQLFSEETLKSNFEFVAYMAPRIDNGGNLHAESLSEKSPRESKAADIDKVVEKMVSYTPGRQMAQKRVSPEATQTTSATYQSQEAASASAPKRPRHTA